MSDTPTPITDADPFDVTANDDNCPRCGNAIFGGCPACVKVEKERLQTELTAANARIAELTESNAVLQSQVDNADINLEQVRMTQKGIWKSKVESAEARIVELEKDCVNNIEAHAKLSYQKNSEIESLTRQLSEAQAQLSKRADNISPEEANELQNVLRTLVPSGRAFIASARELVQRWENQKAEIQALELQIAYAAKHADTFKAQLASAREDGERLNWLEKNCREIVMNNGTESGATVWTESLNTDLRSAIDEARGASPQDGKEHGK